jgi:hypothetical protein
MAYLLIRDAVGSVSCSNKWKIDVVTHLASHGARGGRGTAIDVVNRPGLPWKTLALL